MSEIKLKPCPFCGGEAKLKDSLEYFACDNSWERWFFVTCRNCYAESRKCIECEPLGYAEKCVIEAWNRRDGEQ